MGFNQENTYVTVFTYKHRKLLSMHVLGWVEKELNQSSGSPSGLLFPPLMFPSQCACSSYVVSLFSMTKSLQDTKLLFSLIIMSFNLLARRCYKKVENFFFAFLVLY